MKDSKDVQLLKKLIKKQIAEAKEDRQMSMHEAGVALAKAASASLKALETLKSKSKMPSHKAQSAIDIHIMALEELFNHMWQMPLDYLDATPDEVVGQRKKELADRENSLMDGMHESVSNEEIPGALSQPTFCEVCGTNFDRKLHVKCPKCELEPKDVRMWIEHLKAKKNSKA